MKKLSFTLLLLGLFFIISSAPKGEFYQVISSHPHDMEELAPHIKTIHKEGRLWVVKLKKNAPSNIKSHLRPLSGGEDSYMYRPIFPMRLNFKMPTKIQQMVEQVSRDAIENDVIDLASYRTRRTGTQENKEAVEAALERLKSYGYEVEKVCYSGTDCSVVAEKKGLTRADEVLLVMGHIDSVGASYAGADDNASGTAVLLEMARVLKDYNNQKTIRFFISNGEEQGLRGSTHYVRKLSDEGTLNDISLVINMDMVGYNHTGIVELETDPAYKDLAQWFAELASQYTSLKTKITLGAWGSDHVPFLRKGIPSLLTIEDWSAKTPCYHKACDTPDTLNYEYATEIGKLNLSAILTKDTL
jgi:hypothetical protein